ncbi:uncharacterized protein BCR38DRAFT_446827 [Pseudomassariella vexata]|uniref:Uncharacterized protein n=1 Tax=Pseudomassariella vexata TaxID=1141098 RepID=A0A1Y2DI08_9PEZI|nr:uncharacterized protein BCR38DRAFT_446827 [Pseudomassariella vexata]ORY58873.1 hypothetical protein BCR38DRAFT_446827 [Pseudomassariella vexata]
MFFNARHSAWSQWKRPLGTLPSRVKATQQLIEVDIILRELEGLLAQLWVSVPAHLD